jgi:hypothetical protein
VPSVHGGVSRVDYNLLGRVMRARVDLGEPTK